MSSVSSVAKKKELLYGKIAANRDLLFLGAVAGLFLRYFFPQKGKTGLQIAGGNIDCTGGLDCFAKIPDDDRFHHYYTAYYTFRHDSKIKQKKENDKEGVII